jgi:putative membrane protein
MHLLIRFIVNAIILWLVISFVPGFHNDAGATGLGAYGFWTIFWLAVIFGLVNMLIGPILRLLSAPITWLTHGLFQIVINWVLLAIAVHWAPNVRGTWLSAFIGAVVIMIVGTLITMVFKPEGQASAA